MSQERIQISRRKFLQLGGLLLLSSCAPKFAQREIVLPTPENSQTPTLLPSKTQIPTSTPTRENTPPTSEQKTAVPENSELVLENPVQTPPSLMLHGRDLSQLINLLPLLAQAGYQTTTYEKYYDALLNKKPLKNPILLSIDDLSITYLSSVHEKMISKMEESGMFGTLGIVTYGTRKEVKPEIWQYLKRLQDKGWELAIHTENHVSLPSCSNKQLSYQVEEPYKKIFEATGKAPVSLVLPYGVVASEDTRKIDQRIFKVCSELGIKWVVGIWSGREFSGKSPFYVGRMAPERTADITLKGLNNLF